MEKKGVMYYEFFEEVAFVSQVTCPKRFCPAQTEVWIIFKNSWPVRGLKIKIAPLMGLVVKLPSKV